MTSATAEERLVAAGRTGGARGMRVLLAEDDPAVGRVVVAGLAADGLVVDRVDHGDEALRLAQTGTYQLLLLDLSLPGMDGVHVLRSLRNSCTLPVIVLSGRDSERDRVLGLDLGADDYLTKPFSLRELQSRIRSVLRRAGGRPADPVLRFGDLVMDASLRTVSVGGVPCELTRMEFDLLAYLVSARGRVCSRQELLASVWRSSPDWQDPDTVTEHVRRLRQKLARHGHVERNREPWIKTVRGVGYHFAANVSYEWTLATEPPASLGECEQV